MPYDPKHIVGEILGKASESGYDPAADGFLCPFVKKRCTKRSQGKPYPVCSIWQGRNDSRTPLGDLICVCPKRFYAIDFLRDVVQHCWPGSPPVNPQIAREVKMEGFGNVDFVIADTLNDGEIGQFLSVELQAVDITGSVRDAYDALVSGSSMIENPTSNFNWKNVYKRYITQLIAKGYYHHHWKTKIVAVIQEQVYNYIKKEADFMCSPDVKNPNVNIIFMTYAFDHDPDRPRQYRPVLKTVEGTSHSNLQNAILYKNPPSRDKFCKQIARSFERSRDIFSGR